jgi:hypothetical protein
MLDRACSDSLSRFGPLEIRDELMKLARTGAERAAKAFLDAPVEGGTAAMRSIFKALKNQRLLNANDTIALGTPIFALRERAAARPDDPDRRRPQRRGVFRDRPRRARHRPRVRAPQREEITTWNSARTTRNMLSMWLATCR